MLQCISIFKPRQLKFKIQERQVSWFHFSDMHEHGVLILVNSLQPTEIHAASGILIPIINPTFRHYHQPDEDPSAVMSNNNRCLT